MAGLLYYLPGRDHAALGEAAELGLVHAFERELTPRQVTGAGPDGDRGVICADSTRVPGFGFHADRQEWLKIPGNPANAWVGRYTDKPTLPADLERDETLPGHLVKLADGREWLVPIARGWTEQDDKVCWYEALPTRTSLDEDGNWTQGEVVARLGPLWDAACRWWDSSFAADGEEEAADRTADLRLDFAGRNDAAVTVLAANYRLDRAEVALLGLFDRDTPGRILDAAIDLPSFELLSKKKQPAGD